MFPSKCDRIKQEATNESPSDMLIVSIPSINRFDDMIYSNWEWNIHTRVNLILVPVG